MEVDLTLSTETAAPPGTSINPAWVWKFAESGSYYKAGWAGSHNFQFGFETGVNDNPYIDNINNGITAYYNNGVPLEVTAFNYPLHIDDRFNTDAVYLQDKWTMFRRLTLNLGLRYEHWSTYWPRQVSPPAYFPSIFPQRAFPGRNGVVVWNTASPRIGIAFDPTDKGKSVIRFSFDRYYSMEGTQLAEAINPNSTSTQTYLWNGAKDANGVPLTSEWLQPGNLVASSGGVFTKIDPNLSRPYSDEYAAGYQQQVWRNLTVSATYYHRHHANLMET